MSRSWTMAEHHNPFVPTIVDDADRFGMLGRSLRTGERQRDYRKLVRSLRKATRAADVFDRLIARELADTFVEVARLTQAKDVVLQTSRADAFERLCRDLRLPQKVFDAARNPYGKEGALAM